MTPEHIKKQIEYEVEKVHPFVWPKNKDGEDITMCVGQSMPPGSKKHSKQNEKYVKWAEYGYSLAEPDFEKDLLQSEIDIRDMVINSLEKEIEALKNWKQQAISVMPDMQAIGEALNVKPGEPIHDKILPSILDMQAEIERLKGLTEENYLAYEIKKYQLLDILLTPKQQEEMWQQFKEQNKL